MIFPASLAELRDRGTALFAAAGEETGHVGEIQWDRLHALEAAGMLILSKVEVAGELVGYACAAVVPEFWREGMACETMSLYVQPAHSARWWLALLRAVQEDAIARGADRFRMVAVPGSRFETALRERNTPQVASVFELELHRTP